MLYNTSTHFSNYLLLCTDKFLSITQFSRDLSCLYRLLQFHTLSNWKLNNTHLGYFEASQTERWLWNAVQYKSRYPYNTRKKSFLGYKVIPKCTIAQSWKLGVKWFLSKSYYPISTNLYWNWKYSIHVYISLEIVALIFNVLFFLHFSFLYISWKYKMQN